MYCRHYYAVATTVAPCHTGSLPQGSSPPRRRRSDGSGGGGGGAAQDLLRAGWRRSLRESAASCWAGGAYLRRRFEPSCICSTDSIGPVARSSCPGYRSTRPAYQSATTECAILIRRLSSGHISVSSYRVRDTEDEVTVTIRCGWRV